MAEILTKEQRGKVEESILARISENPETLKLIVQCVTDTAAMDMILVTHINLTSTQIGLRFGFPRNYINMRRFYLRARAKV